MGSCIQVIFNQKLSPKNESLLSRTTPQKLNSAVNKKHWSAQNFYCTPNLPQIQQFLDKLYRQLYNYSDQMMMHNTISPIGPADKQFLSESLHTLNQFIKNIKENQSAVYRQFIKDQQKMAAYFLEKNLTRKLSFTKKPSNNANKIEKQLKQCPTNRQICQSDIILLKLEIKMLLMKPGIKKLEMFLDQKQLLKIQIKNNSYVTNSLHSSTGQQKNSSNQKKPMKEKPKNDMQVQNKKKQPLKDDNQLANYQVGEFISTVTSKDKNIILKIPAMNIRASIPVQDLLYRQNSIILNDFVPLKKKGSDQVFGYAMFVGQAFLFDKFKSDFNNIRKQHQILRKQIQYCLKQEWQQLYDIKHSSSSCSHMHSQSLYSEFPKQSMQFQLKM